MRLLRSCLVATMTLIAFGFVAAAIWFGVVGLIGPDAFTSASRPTPIPPASGATASPRLADSPTGGVLPTATVAGPGPVAPGSAGAATVAPGSGEVQLARLTDAELTAGLRAALAAEQGGAVIDEPRVRISGGKVELTGRLRGVVPLPIDVLIVGRIDVRDGQPVVAVERVEGVGVPLPPLAARRIELLINSLALVPLPEGVTVTHVDHGEGALTVYGRRR
ncbi:MAG: hypothetical protein IT340_02710 [Chloroflexi bacterium]|nr:hypothetical protein [Chloroflexota bacterium]